MGIGDIPRVCLLVAGIVTASTAPAPAAAAPPAHERLRQADPPPSHPDLDLAIQRQESRHKHTNLSALLDTLEIAQGLTILDIGAGPGYASFLFAERLRGSGAVYATDIRSDFVEHIAAQAKRRGLDNLSAAVVSENGLDEFYARQRYDLVFLSNVYHALDARVDYFSRLRAFLKPGARLVVILYNQTPLFTADDFARPDALAKSLAREPPESPFVVNLSETTRKLLGGAGDAAAIESALVEDFNRMLTDPQFYRNFYRDSYFTKGFFTPAERDLANWLLMTLAEDGVIDGTPELGGERKLRTAIKLNRLFFIKRFGEFLAEDGRGAYYPAGDANRHTSKYVLFKELDAAGYRLVKEMRLSAYYDAVIMVPQAP